MTLSTVLWRFGCSETSVTFDINSNFRKTSKKVNDENAFSLRRLDKTIALTLIWRVLHVYDGRKSHNLLTIQNGNIPYLFRMKGMRLLVILC